MPYYYRKLLHKEKDFMKHTLLTLLFIILATILPVSVYAQQSLLVVFGIDESGSYDFRNKAISIAGRVISDLKPGDVLYIRRITDKSYDDSCAVFRLEIPEIGNPPSNKFDRRAWHNWKKKNRGISALKAKAIDVLTKLGPVKAPMTDIWGFIAAAADRIHTEQEQDYRSVVVICSDMKDNCHRKTTLDLNGAQMLIAGFESGKDPAKSQKIKSDWDKVLKGYNAASVNFLPPDCKLLINANP